MESHVEQHGLLAAADGSDSTSTSSTTKVHEEDVACGTTAKIWAWLQDSWFLEITACVIIIVMLGVQIVILLCFDGQNIDSWPISFWSINSVISVPTVVTDAAIGFAVASCLGQLRWLWFKESEEALIWMDLLSKASSPTGAVMFLTHRRAWRRWAALGALITVTALGAHIATQNVIKRTGFMVPVNETSKVPISLFYDNYLTETSGDKAGDQEPDLAMISAINSGFVPPVSPQDNDTIYQFVDCMSGNCSFGQYSSLAVCSRCANLSTHITSTDDQYIYPDGSLTLDISTGYLNMTSDTNYPDPSVMSNVAPLIARFKALASGNKAPPHATECVAYWCVKTYRSSMVNNFFDESITGISDMNTQITYPVEHKNITLSLSNNITLGPNSNTTRGPDYSITLSPSTCYHNNTSQYGDNCTFRVGYLTHLALQNYLTHGSAEFPIFLSGSNSAYSHDRWNTTSLAAETTFEPCDDMTDGCANQLYKGIGAGFQNMTVYMTQNLRKPAPGDETWSYGTTSRSILVFHVRWPWMVYPAAVGVACFIFVIGTVIRSRHQKPWKTSTLALMFHSFHNLDRVEREKLSDPQRMREVTDGASAVLHPHGFELKGHATYLQGRRADEAEK